MRLFYYPIFYTGIATILCVYSFVRKLKSGKDISKVDLIARWLGPMSYFLFLIAIFYNIKGTLALISN